MSGTDFYYDGLPTLAERLQATMPMYTDKNGQKRQDYKVFFGNSGAEANEGAIKLARYHTGRQNVVSFYRSFHGRTYGAMSLTASKSIHKKRVGPLLPGVFHAQYPFHYQEPMGATEADTAKACLEWFESNIFGREFPADELAAIVVEPIQGEGGYIVPHDSWLLGLQTICRKHGAILIVDEVQAGMGRTGKVWASNHVAGFEPDIMTSAKGLASGLPLGAIIAKADVMNWVPGVHATTSPCSAAQSRTAWTKTSARWP
jgi:4-aminobutyrate aminotransferase